MIKERAPENISDAYLLMDKSVQKRTNFVIAIAFQE
jgi:hypothetical protein